MSEVRAGERHGQSHDFYGEDPVSGSALGIGEIRMWYGVLTDLPRNWQVCDGTNGTPDMAGRTPVGVGANPAHTYALGDAAGADINSVTLIHSGAAVADHGHHTHVNGGTVSLSGAGVNAWSAAPSGNENATQTHNVTQPSDHSFNLDVRPYLRALYFVMRIS